MKYIFSIITALYLTIALPLSSYANNTSFFTEQGKVHIVTAGINPQTREAKLAIHYKLAPGWKIYWRTPGDSGTPTEISLDGSTNIKNPILFWPTPKRHIDRISDDLSLTSYVYENEVALPLKATIENSSAPIQAKLALNFSICRNICIPYQTTFNFEVPYTTSLENTSLFNKYMARVPTIAQPSNLESLTITSAEFLNNEEDELFLHVAAVSTKSTFNAFTSDIFIENLPSYTASSPKIILSNNKQKADFYVPLTPTIKGKHVAKLLRNTPLTVTLKSGSHAIEANISGLKIVKSSFSIDNPYEDSTPEFSLWLMLLYALIGGLILNIMPCVLPVLSIKLMGLLSHSGGNDTKARKSLLTTASGIVFSFLILAAGATTLKLTGQAVGWGIHFQQPAFIIALTIIIVLFALNMLDRFEIHLPHKLGSKALSASTTKDQHSPAGNFLMGAFATLLATPCSAPFLGVAVSFALSQTISTIFLIFLFMGAGMALPYLFFALFPQLITTLPKPGDWMKTVKQILAILLIMTALWLLWVLSGQLGKMPAIIAGAFCLLIKFVVEKERGILGKKTAKLIVIPLLIIFTFVTPLSFVDHMEQQEQKVNEIWIPFEESAIADHIAQGHIVVVDVTADWCTTCQTNKFFVLHRDYILDILARPDVIAMRLDLTNPNPIGQEFLQKHERYGIPFNIIYGPKAPNGVKLPVLLTASRVKNALIEAGL